MRALHDGLHSRFYIVMALGQVAEFALLGFDYLVDSNKKIWNIEVNDWPCIEWKAKPIPNDLD